jgi:hypothetical protein
MRDAPNRRALSEEVAFDRAKVTSTDWLSYPILDITEAPETVDIVLIKRPELPPAGAGESSIRTGRRGARQRGLRRHRRAPAPRAANPRAPQAGVSMTGSPMLPAPPRAAGSDAPILQRFAVAIGC